MRILNNHHSTEDVVQESLMKAYVALKSYSKEQLQTLRIRPWLCAIVRNTANNYRVQERRFELLDLSEDSELLEIEGNRFEQPELAIMVNETANEFHEIIRRLPQQYRAVVLLRFMEEFKSKELAQAMNISNMNTLKSYMRRSLRLMRKIAEEMDISGKDLGIWAQAQCIYHDIE